MGHESIQTTYEYVVLGPEEQKAEERRVSNTSRVSIGENVPNESVSHDIMDELFNRYRNVDISLEELIQALLCLQESHSVLK